MTEEKIAFYLNDRAVSVSVPPAARVLDLIRNRFALFGTKEGCREGECGSCTVLLGRPEAFRISYRAVPSCLLAAAELDGNHLVTIEGLGAATGGLPHPQRSTPFQVAFVEEGAVQCGFCTPGLLMALTGYLLSGREVSVEGALDSIDGNICRCTGYVSIKRAVASVIDGLAPTGRVPNIEKLVEGGFLPPYFRDIPEKLHTLPREASQRLRPSREGGDQTLLAGGTDLLIQAGEALQEKGVLLLSRLGLPEAVGETTDGISIPASLSIEELRVNPIVNRFYPGLEEKLLLFASTILRNRATVGGNLVNASPIGDLSVLFTAFGAELILGPTDDGALEERRVKIEEFFLGYKRVDLKAGEILKSIEIPKPKEGHRWGFARVAKRERLDIPACSAGFALEFEAPSVRSARIAFGGVSPVPLLASSASAALEGTPLRWETVRDVAEIAQSEIRPIDDLRGSAAYRRVLTTRLLYALFLEVFPEHLDYAEIASEIGGTE